MIHDWKPIEKLAGRFNRLCEVLDVKTSGGKIMLAAEFWISIILAFVVIIFSAEGFIIAFVALVTKGQAELSHPMGAFSWLAIIMALSLLLVFLRERLFPQEK